MVNGKEEKKRPLYGKRAIGNQKKGKGRIGKKQRVHWNIYSLFHLHWSLYEVFNVVEEVQNMIGLNEIHAVFRCKKIN